MTPKTVGQQDIQSLLRMRTNYIGIRSTVSNQKLKQAVPVIFDRSTENGLKTQMKEMIEGIGPITALAIIALVENALGFKNSRYFSAYLGLVPRQ